MSRFLYEVGFFFCNLYRCAPTLIMQITQSNVIITEIPFDFSQKYQTVPRPNRRATVYFGTQLISVGCILLHTKTQCGPCQPPAFCRQVPLFYAKCPSKNILQVGRSGHCRIRKPSIVSRALSSSQNVSRDSTWKWLSSSVTLTERPTGGQKGLGKRDGTPHAAD